jgi:hypothetical protein
VGRAEVPLETTAVLAFASAAPEWQYLPAEREEEYEV